jgi:transposase
MTTRPASEPARLRATSPTSAVSAKRSSTPGGQKSQPARRWVVERTLAWLSKCRALLVRYDKKPQNYKGLIQLACALLWCRRLHAALGWGEGVSR